MIGALGAVLLELALAVRRVLIDRAAEAIADKLEELWRRRHELLKRLQELLARLEKAWGGFWDESDESLATA
jgi:hypothetical protein